MRSAYWLLSDDRLDLCRLPSQCGLFKAHFKHSLLFNPVLTVPDSYVVNNYNFRRALSHDETVRGLVEDQLLRVVTRATDDGDGKTLVQIRDEMPEDKVPREFSAAEYASNEDLVFVDEVAPRDTYDVNGVAQRYAIKSVEVFRSAKAADALGARVAEQISELAREAAGLDGQLAVLDAARLSRFGRAFFFYELPKHFRLVTGQDWAAYESRVLHFANSPYLTALPAVLNLEPIYAPEHQGAFEIIRGSRGSREQTVGEIRFASPLGLQSFAKGMELLERDDLLALLDSDEAARFHQAIGDTGDSQPNVREIQVSLQAYQLRIEDRIAARFHGLTGESADGRDKHVRITFDDVVGAAGDGLAVLAVVFSSVSALSLLGLALTRPAKRVLRHVTGATKRSQEQQAERELAQAQSSGLREQTLDHFMRKSPERIDAAGYWGPAGKEVLYKDVH